MRAVVCRRPGELALVERPEERRAEGEALIAVRRIGICGTDYHIYEGTHPYLQYPRVIGHELSGEVLETTPGSAFTLGQRVVVNPYVSCGACIACRKGKPNCCLRIEVLGVHRDGGMCERISVPERNLYPAGSLTFDEAASVEFLSIGAHAAARSGLKPGDRALVVGAGPIGLGVALFAGLAGGNMTVIDLDCERLDFVDTSRDCGARHSGRRRDGRAGRRGDQWRGIRRGVRRDRKARLDRRGGSPRGPWRLAGAGQRGERKHHFFGSGASQA